MNAILLELEDRGEHRLYMTWSHGDCKATLDADLRAMAFVISHQDEDGDETVRAYC